VQTRFTPEPNGYLHMSKVQPLLPDEWHAPGKPGLEHWRFCAVANVGRAGHVLGVDVEVEDELGLREMPARGPKGLFPTCLTPS
jgi:hypothetical protein